MFGYEDRLVFPIYALDQKFEDFIDLLFLIDVDNHIMCASKILTDLCFTK